jgi:phosphonate transport system substrate-binding protein
MRKDLPESTKQNIKDFFFAYGSGGQQEKDALMTLSKLSGFKASTNAQLIPIRQLALFKEKSKLESDTGMAVADKTRKIAEIDKQLAALVQ